MDPTWTWKVSYTTSKDLDRGWKKEYDGQLHLWSSNDCVALINAKGQAITEKFLQNGEIIDLGSSVAFPCHVARVLRCLVHPVPSREISDPVPLVEVGSSNAVHSSMAMKLDFSHGYSFADEIKRRFRTTVHPLTKADHFLLAISFGRATFKLNEDSVSLALESCIGGLCDDLCVIQLSDRVFRFLVSTRYVGFLVYAMRSFTCESFKCYFHLWGNGGPNWRREFDLWKSECQEEWTIISPGKRRSMKAMKALKSFPLKSSLSKNQGKPLARKLSFATIEKYEACSGYAFPLTSAMANDLKQAGYNCPQVNRLAGVFIPDHLSVTSEEQIPFGSFLPIVEGSGLGAISGCSNSKDAFAAGPDVSQTIGASPHSAQDDSFANMISDMADDF
jgi:hypothetical protein